MPADSKADPCAVSLIVPTLNQNKYIERPVDRSCQAPAQVAGGFEVIVEDVDSPDIAAASRLVRGGCAYLPASFLRSGILRAAVATMSEFFVIRTRLPGSPRLTARGYKTLREILDRAVFPSVSWRLLHRVTARMPASLAIWFEAPVHDFQVVSQLGLAANLAIAPVMKLWLRAQTRSICIV